MRLNRFSVLALLASVAATGQQIPTARCALEKASDGEQIVLAGRIERTAHDLLLRLPNCEAGVLLEYAGAPGSGVSVTKLRRDRSLAYFEKVSNARYKSSNHEICASCFKYDVEATFVGILNVASVPAGTTRDQFGFARDESGKVVANAGWGHPTPVYRYRLVIESVSDVHTQAIPKPVSD